MKGQIDTATDDGCIANSRDKKSEYKTIAFSVSALTIAKDNVPINDTTHMRWALSLTATLLSHTYQNRTCSRLRAKYRSKSTTTRQLLEPSYDSSCAIALLDPLADTIGSYSAWCPKHLPQDHHLGLGLKLQLQPGRNTSIKCEVTLSCKVKCLKSQVKSNH